MMIAGVAMLVAPALAFASLAPAQASKYAFASGTNLHYRVWTTEEGLPQGSVRAIAQTPDGYIWIATLDGLVRFDGVQMTVFTASDFPEMRSNRCVLLFVDRQGTLWVGTEDGGILRISGSRRRSFGRLDGLTSEGIDRIVQDAEGRIWTLTGEGPMILEGDRWTIPDARLRIPDLPRAPDPWPPPFVPPERRTKWAGLWSGADGALWVLDGDRLHRRGGSVWQTFATPVPDVILPAVFMFEDREGTLWIGGQRGLVQANPTPVRSIVPPSAVPDERNVYTLAEDSSGRVWIGTQLAPMLWDRGTMIALAEQPWWPRNWVTTMEPDTDGTLLASGPSHLFRVWPGRRFERLPGEYHAMDFLRDRRGTLWIATDTGLLHASEDTWVRIEGLPSNQVRVLLEARDGALWAGTYGGLARVAGGKVQSWTTADGLSSDRIRSLYEDETGTLWIGTYDGGLNRFADGTFVHIRKRNGLYDDGVFAILDDGEGRFWMSSNRGVHSVARSELDAFASGALRAVSSRAWRSADGMPASECNGGRQPSAIRTADGNLWFPTQRGIAIFDPRAIRENELPPPVLVEEVKTDRRTIPLGDPIALRPGERRLEVRFTANTFVRPEGARFRHRLAGFDDDWIEGSRRFAQYGDIPPGHYVLNILAANSDGVWSPEGVSLPISIEPYWWQTLWFRSSATLLALAALVAAFQWRVSALKRRRIEQDVFARRLLESQEAERKRIASELHDGIGQTLVVIRNRAMLGLQDGPVSQLEEISVAAGDVIDEVRRVAYGLRPNQLDRLGLTGALQALVDQTAKSSGLHIRAEITDIDGLVAKADEINVYRIVQEALSNVVRHARASSGRVAVGVRGSEIEIRIEDDGEGFLSRAAADSRGLGLTGIAERARILGGRATVRSTLGQGTSVNVYVPRRDREG